MSEKVFSNLSTDEIEIYLEDFIEEGLGRNLYDFNFKNIAVLNCNLEDKLQNIKAKTMIIYSDESVLFYQPLNIEKVKECIDDVTILSYSSKKENYYDEEDFSEIGMAAVDFLKEVIKN